MLKKKNEEWGMSTLDRAFLIAGLISLSFLIGISSCDDNGKTKNDSTPTKQKIESTLKGHQWRITNFSDEKEESKHFLGYSFQFNSDGTVVARKNETSVNGVWSTFNSGNGQLKLSLEFTLTEPFDELSDDWIIEESENNMVRIVEMSGGSDNADEVIFESV
jgi:hypothetical protein